MPAAFAFSSLPVYVHRDESQGVYKFGVLLNGVFVVFATRKLGGIDDDLTRAAEAAAAAAAQPTPAPAETPPPAPPADATPADEPEQTATEPPAG